MSKKSKGQIFTPDYLVKEILDFAKYNTTSILEKHIIDHSCGNGAFLIEIVNRYCDLFLSIRNEIDLLKIHLETYIHGIELDTIAYNECIISLNKVVAKYNIHNVQWNILNTDALTCFDFNKKMDFVVGNPPYVRVHNLENYSDVKDFHFAQQGMTDLYIVFFELGFNMLSSNGVMCIITPSSWLSSRAGSILRDYIYQHKNLSGVIDLEHFQAFDATTYTIISRFNSYINEKVEYNTFDGNLHNKEYLTYNTFSIKGKFYFSDYQSLNELTKILSTTKTKKIFVKNGFATLADKIFINDFDFDECTIDILKASSGKWKKCFFPYDKLGKPISIDTIKSKYPSAFAYINSQKEILLNRDAEDKNNWHLFGRTQALSDVYKDKIAINSIIKDIDSIKLNKVSSGQGIYSGLYILTDISFEEIEKIIKTTDFITYLKTLKNYKSGGYYTLSSKELELYLNYKINE